MQMLKQAIPLLQAPLPEYLSVTGLLQQKGVNLFAHLMEIGQERTGLESRVTILGHVQRGGTPSHVDRLLATRLGAEAAQAVADGDFGVMIASQGGEAVRVPLIDVAGTRRTVPLDHPWIQTARQLGMNLGD